jgi:hypothetical protein
MTPRIPAPRSEAVVRRVGRELLLLIHQVLLCLPGITDEIAVKMVNRWQNIAMEIRSTDKALKRGEWQHLFVTYDGSGRAPGLKLFVNGVEVKANRDSNRLEDTIVKTNTDAIKEIVRQIRLRDLGGIIVVDFIDMDERRNRQKVMQALEEAMRSDRAPNKILQFNDFGLVAITRKRVKQSLERTLCMPCTYCEGAGYIKSAQTVVGEILQEAHKIAKAVEGKDVLLRVSPDVAKLLKSNENSFLQEMEEILGRTVIVKSDPELHQEKFDLA